MKLPKQVIVGPCRYEVVRDEAVINKAQVERKTDLLGSHDGQRQRLILAPDQAPDCEADTLLHEILHACYYIGGGQKDDDQEEEFVATVSGLLLDCLRRNPQLVSYLTDAH